MGRHLREGSKNLIRNKWLTLISLLSVMVTLFIVGVFTLLIMNVSFITSNIEKDVEAVVYLDLDIEKNQVNKIEKEISKIKEIDELKFINKEDGLENLIGSLGEHGVAFESLKEDNPLNDTFVITPKIPEQIEMISNTLKGLDGVERVDYGKNVVDSLFNITGTVKNIGFVLIIGLIVTALLLISNTIKNSIDVRKEEIKIMRLVGASNSYIRYPFLFEGLMIGLIGAIVPLAVIYLGYGYILSIYKDVMSIDFMTIMSINESMPLIVLIVLGLSLIIGGLGSMISIRKHLNT